MPAPHISVFAMTSARVRGRVTLTAMVTPPAGGHHEPGWVTFFDGDQVLGTTELAGKSRPAKATLTVPSLAGGMHRITARFTSFFDAEEQGSALILIS